MVECEWTWTIEPSEAYIFATYDDPHSSDDATRTAALLEKQYGWHCSKYVVGEEEYSASNKRQQNAALTFEASVARPLPPITPPPSRKSVPERVNHSRKIHQSAALRRRQAQAEYQEMLEREHLD